MKHRVVVTGLGLVTPLGNTVEATFATPPTRNATWIMWRTKRARRLWNTHSRTVSASVRTRHSFSDALRSKQTRSAEFAAEMGAGADVGRSSIPAASLPGAQLSCRERFGSVSGLGGTVALSPCCTLGTKHSKIILICTVSSPPRSVLRSQPLALGVQKLPLPRHIPKPGISCRLLRYRGTAVSFSHRQYVGRRRESPIRFILPSLLRQSLFEA